MAYIGTDINYGNIAKQTGTGDGADTTPIAALTYTVPSSESILVFLDGVCQVPSTDFTATGTTLTFTTAPANGVAILVMFLGRSLDIGTPADNTVATAKLVNNAVDETKLKDALIGDFSDATVTASDTFLHGDATDSGNTKRDTVQGILDLAGGGDLRNFIIDGDFTQWPEGTAATTTSSWKSALWYGRPDIGTVEFSRSTDVPTVAQSNHRSSYSFKVDCTSTGSVASGTKLKLYYWMTGSDYAHIHKQAFVFSFWVKSYQTGIHTVGFQNTASTRSYVAEYTVSSSATWERKEIAVPAESADTDWAFTEADKGMQIIFSLASGSTYNTTAGSWAGGNYNGSSNTQNITSSTSNEIYISQLMLTLGTSAPSAFLGESISTVRNQVDWYIQRYDAVGANGDIMMMAVNTTGQMQGPFDFRREMRKIPTITFSSYNTFRGHDGVSDTLLTGLASSDVSKLKVTFKSADSGYTWDDGHAGRMTRDSSDTCFIQADARH